MKIKLCIEPLNDFSKKRNEMVLIEAREMWKNPPTIEQAKKQVAAIKADMREEEDERRKDSM